MRLFGSGVDIPLAPLGVLGVDPECPTYPIWGYDSDGNPRSSINIDGTDAPCGGATNDTQYCTIPGNLGDGAHVATISCSGGDSTNGDVHGGTTFEFTVDNTPPTLTITSPLPGSVGPALNFHTEGTTDANGATIQIGPYTITAMGNNWTADFPNLSSVLNGSANSLTLVQVNVKASDGLNDIQKTINVLIDGIGPNITILSPASASGDDLTSVSGTVKDSSGTDNISIAALNSTTGKYWNPSSRKFDSDHPNTESLVINSGLQNQEATWSYNGITSRDLRPGHTYRFNLSATDIFGNNSQRSIDWTFTRSSLKTIKDQIRLAAAGQAMFSDPNPSVAWGGVSATRVCVSFSSRLKLYDVNFVNKISAKAEDGSVTLQEEELPNYMPGLILFQCDPNSGDTQQIQLTIRSRPTSCLRQGKIRIYYDGTIIGEAVVNIIAPTATTAVPLYRHLGEGIDPVAECSLANVNPPCRYDKWRLSGDGPINTEGPNLLFTEDQRFYEPLIYHGARLRMCPIRGVTHTANQFQTMQLGYIGDDRSGFDEIDVSKFANCGHKSKQGIVFASTQNTPAGVLGRCEFVTDIIKTTRMDSRSSISTRRSDAANSIDRP